ncbi:unnamed protein product [Parascedosporium putredinis]|uniref:4-coumarate-CoA ligase n=1 Tax=Parascedosporium putredinis TaxID=1442378 RepID=A0A9P1H4A7_9PEZI|nr:unnamed protein product [Parascedosporium putredinis]CAI7995519.1 unnamed protein product [Parascedosporium putredinis]
MMAFNLHFFPTFTASSPIVANHTSVPTRLKQIAVGLQEAGLRLGDRVLIFSGNNIYFPVIFLGVLMAGGIVTGANPGFKPREIAHQLRDSGASFMVAAASNIQTATEGASEAGLPARNVFAFDTTIPGSASVEIPAAHGARHWTELLAPRERAEKFDWVEPADARTTTCCLNYSSGTTGLPKGVEISHYSYVANGTGVIKLAEQKPDYPDFTKRSGIPVYIMPSFDFPKMLSHIAKYRVTHLVAVPPILVLLAKHPLTPKADLSSLEIVGSGAAPLALEIAHETQNLLPRDIYVRQGWGMTEVTCTCLAWDGSNDSGTSGAVGELMPNCQAKLMSLDGTTEITKAETRGELWVTGPTLMRGYWKNAKATQDSTSVDADGTRWLKTGDIAYVESYKPGTLFHVVDRLKELIKVKGRQVAPAELEALLLEHPAVADVAVIGVDIEGEERPRAYIVPKEGLNPSGGEIASWVETRVAPYKRLTGGVIFTDIIPKNPSGKILRKLLRDQAKAEVQKAKL